jgi:glycosyltransferase involved in cell wall biosynthesis
MCDVRWYNANAHYVVELTRGLRAAGHEVALWARERTPIVSKAEAAGIPVILHRRADPFKLFRLWWLVKRGKYDIVNAHRGSDLFLVMLLKSLHSVKVVVTRSDIRPFKNNVINRYFFAEQVDQVILSGHFHQEQGMMSPFALPEECITVIPLGIEMPPLATVSSQLDSLRLVLVGRFDPVKGHQTVLDAFRLLQREFPQTELGFIGYPATIETAELRRQAAGLPVKIIDRQVDMVSTLARYQIGIIASNASEAVPRAGLEYLSRGMPVVGTRINSIPELIEDGVNGLVVPPDDPVAMARAFIRICREYSAFESGVRLSRERYSLIKMVQATVTTYRRLLP